MEEGHPGDRESKLEIMECHKANVMINGGIVSASYHTGDSVRGQQRTRFCGHCS